MDFHDPTSYTDLTQGRISHIDFHIQADFSSCTLDIEATYQMQSPLHGSLHLDTFKLEMKQAHANGRDLEWGFVASDEVLGERLHLKGFDGESSFTLKFRTSPEARALQWMNASQTVGGEYPFLQSVPGEQCAQHLPMPGQPIGAVHVFGESGSAQGVDGGHGSGAG